MINCKEISDYFHKIHSNHDLLLFFVTITPCFFFSVNSQALPDASLPLIIWRLIAYPYLARCSLFNDVSTIQPSKLPFPPLNFDSIGLSNFPANAWNVFLHTSTHETTQWNHEEEIEMNSSALASLHITSNNPPRTYAHLFSFQIKVSNPARCILNRFHQKWN